MRKRKRRTRKTSTKTPQKGALVKGYLEKAPGQLLELFGDELRALLRGASGIYALYKDRKLYYIGLATHLRGRIQGHLEDKHRGKWNRFSAYVVRRTRYIKDLETLILRLARPKANLQIGRFRRDQNLRQRLAARLREYQRAIQLMRRR